jgi:hypothetical protein
MAAWAEREKHAKSAPATDLLEPDAEYLHQTVACLKHPEREYQTESRGTQRHERHAIAECARDEKMMMEVRTNPQIPGFSCIATHSYEQTATQHYWQAK